MSRAHPVGVGAGAATTAAVPLWRQLRVMVRRQLRVNRTVVLVMSAIWAVNSVAQVVSYEKLFPSATSRAATLATFTSNGGLRALYGYPYDIGSATGWLAWRAMGFVVIVIAMWAAVMVTGALRGEEESGRAELALGQPVARGSWFAAGMVAVVVEGTVIAGATVLALSAICVPRGLTTVPGALGIGLQMLLPALLFAAVGAVAAQLMGTTRGARIAVGGVLVVAFFARTAADTGSGQTWLRWLSPLGWFEELHPPAAPAPAALIAILLSTAVLTLLAVLLFARRDLDAGILPRHDARSPRRLLLGGTGRAALRDNLPQLSIWAVAALLTMLLMGSLTNTVLDLVRHNHRFGRVLGEGFAVNSYLAAIFSIVQVVVTLMVVTLLVGARGEEASGRLELLLGEPLSRGRWLTGRMVLATAAATVLAVLSAFALWAGAVGSGVDVGAGPVLAAGLNCVPLILFAVGAAAAVFGSAPRAVAFVYAPVAIAYLWEALGTAFKAPDWSLYLTPFHWLAAVPAKDFAPLPAAVLTLAGLTLLAVALASFRRRDLAAG